MAVAGRGTLQQQQRHLRASYVSAFAAHLSLSIASLTPRALHSRVSFLYACAYGPLLINIYSIYLFVVPSFSIGGNCRVDAPWAPLSPQTLFKIFFSFFFFKYLFTLPCLRTMLKLLVLGAFDRPHQFHDLCQCPFS